MRGGGMRCYATSPDLQMNGLLVKSGETRTSYYSRGQTGSLEGLAECARKKENKLG
ncbi:hypothetical protein M404DRAFT_997285 [Pisolithus tinctorius Marx 270]|uniref:Uncharacterized protein n=1 Tax=Pisolithus tinctorius Marx 270 TaxID=870435 RepID=A0A0C3P5H8_PISTI|nr:hypothetical protein M404DRAFT_997285 [Pisolithus tinctorius Marx 270]